MKDWFYGFAALMVVGCTIAYAAGFLIANRPTPKATCSCWQCQCCPACPGSEFPAAKADCCAKK